MSIMRKLKFPLRLTTAAVTLIVALVAVGLSQAQTSSDEALAVDKANQVHIIGFDIDGTTLKLSPPYVFDNSITDGNEGPWISILYEGQYSGEEESNTLFKHERGKPVKFRGGLFGITSSTPAAMDILSSVDGGFTYKRLGFSANVNGKGLGNITPQNVNWMLVAFEDNLYAVNGQKGGSILVYKLGFDAGAIGIEEKISITSTTGSLFTNSETLHSIVAYKGQIVGITWDRKQIIIIDVISGTAKRIPWLKSSPRYPILGVINGKLITNHTSNLRRPVSIYIDDTNSVASSGSLNDYINVTQISRLLHEGAVAEGKVYMTVRSEIFPSHSNVSSAIIYETFTPAARDAGNWDPKVRTYTGGQILVELPPGKPDAGYYRIQRSVAGKEWETLEGVPPMIYPANSVSLDQAGFVPGETYALRACGYRSNTELYVCSRSVEFTASLEPGVEEAVADYNLANRVELHLLERSGTDINRYLVEQAEVAGATGSYYAEVPASGSEWQRTDMGKPGVGAPCRSCVVLAEDRYYAAIGGTIYRSESVDGRFAEWGDSSGISNIKSLGYWRGHLLVISGNYTTFNLIRLADGVKTELSVTSASHTISTGLNRLYLSAYGPDLYGIGGNGSSMLSIIRFDIAEQSVMITELADTKPSSYGSTIGLGVISGKLLAFSQVSSGCANSSGVCVKFWLVHPTGNIIPPPARWRLPVYLNGNDIFIGSASYNNSIPMKASKSDLRMLVTEEFADDLLQWTPTATQSLSTVKVSISQTGLSNRNYVVQVSPPGESAWLPPPQTEQGYISSSVTTATLSIRLVSGYEYLFRVCALRSNGEPFGCSQPAKVTGQQIRAQNAIPSYDYSYHVSIDGLISNKQFKNHSNWHIGFKRLAKFRLDSYWQTLITETADASLFGITVLNDTIRDVFLLDGNYNIVYNRGSGTGKTTFNGVFQGSDDLYSFFDNSSYTSNFGLSGTQGNSPTAGGNMEGIGYVWLQSTSASPPKSSLARLDGTPAMKAEILFSVLSTAELSRVDYMQAYQGHLYAIGKPEVDGDCHLYVGKKSDGSADTNTPTDCAHLVQFDIENKSIANKRYIHIGTQLVKLSDIRGFFVLKGYLILALSADEQTPGVTQYVDFYTLSKQGTVQQIAQPIPVDLANLETAIFHSGTRLAYTPTDYSTNISLQKLIVREQFVTIPPATGNWFPQVESRGGGNLEIIASPPTAMGNYMKLEWSRPSKGGDVQWEKLATILTFPKYRTTIKLALQKGQSYGFRACGYRTNGELTICSRPTYFLATEDDVGTLYAHEKDIPYRSIMHLVLPTSQGVLPIEYSAGSNGNIKTLTAPPSALKTTSLDFSHIFEYKGRYFAISGNAGTGQRKYALYESDGDITGTYRPVENSANGEYMGVAAWKNASVKAPPRDVTVFEERVLLLNPSGNLLYELDIDTGIASLVTSTGVWSAITAEHLFGYRGSLYAIDEGSGFNHRIFRISSDAGIATLLTQGNSTFDERLRDIYSVFVIYGNLMMLGDWDQNADGDTIDDGDYEKAFLHLSSPDQGLVSIDYSAILAPVIGGEIKIEPGVELDFAGFSPTPSDFRLLITEFFPPTAGKDADWSPDMESQSSRDMLVTLPVAAPEIPYYQLQWLDVSLSPHWVSTEWRMPGVFQLENDTDRNIIARMLRVPGQRYSLRMCARRSNTDLIFCSSPHSFVAETVELSDISGWQQNMLLALGQDLDQVFVLDTLSGQAQVLRPPGEDWPNLPNMQAECMFQYQGEVWIGYGGSENKFHIWDPLSHRMNALGGGGFGVGETQIRGCALHNNTIYIVGNSGKKLIRIDPQTGERDADWVSLTLPSDFGFGGVQKPVLAGLTSYQEKLLAVSEGKGVYELSLDEASGQFGKAKLFNGKSSVGWDEQAGAIQAIAAVGSEIYVLAAAKAASLHSPAIPAGLYRYYSDTGAISPVGDAYNFDLHLTERYLAGRAGESQPKAMTFFNPPSNILDPALGEGVFTDAVVGGLELEIIAPAALYAPYRVIVSWNGLPQAIGYDLKRVSRPGLPDEFLDCKSGGKVGQNSVRHSCVFDAMSETEYTDGFTVPSDGAPFYLVSYSVRPYYELPGMKREYGGYSIEEQQIFYTPQAGLTLENPAGASTSFDPLGLDIFLEGEFDDITGKPIFGLPLIGAYVDGYTVRHVIGVVLGIGLAGLVMSGFGGPLARSGRMAATILATILWILIANQLLGMPVYWIAAILTVLALSVIVKLYVIMPKPGPM